MYDAHLNGAGRHAISFLPRTSKTPASIHQDQPTKKTVPQMKAKQNQ
jgi:hypothetical protein